MESPVVGVHGPKYPVDSLYDEITMHWLKACTTVLVMCLVKLEMRENLRENHLKVFVNIVKKEQ